jgi:hypothetical protein
MKFVVTVVRYGGVTVEANSREEAIKEVEDNALLSDVSWDDDWTVTDAVDVAEED